MSRRTKIYCDVCHCEKQSDEVFSIKVKSDFFVNYVNYDQLFANRKKWDICTYCIDGIGRAVRQAGEHHE